jgi:hypothetical protein
MTSVNEMNAVMQERARLREEVVKMMMVEVHDEPCDGYCSESACYLPDKIHKNRVLADVLALLRE